MTSPTAEPWHDAARTAWHEWDRLRSASDPLAFAQALIDLSNAMSDLVTWLPDWDAETGVLGERVDDGYY